VREQRRPNRTEIPHFTDAYLEATAQNARNLHREALAPATIRAYEHAWGRFKEWCEAGGFPSLPCTEATAIGYISALEAAAVSYSTISRHVAAIKWAHETAGSLFEATPALERVTQGIARRRRDHKPDAATALTPEDLRTILAGFGSDPKDIRDRAVILLGFCTGLRRSEIVRLTIEDMEPHQDGLRAYVSHSKTDQTGKGTYRAIPKGSSPSTCPVTAYWAWLHVSGVTTGRIFRAIRKGGAVWGEGLNDQAIADILRSRALAAGLTGGNAKWSGHSMRRGFATTAARNGVSRAQIMQDGGWKSNAVDTYIDAGESFKDRAANRLGL
jgi:site-specific recombinase XerD